MKTPKGKLLIAFITLIVLVLVGLGGYFYYQKTVTDKNNQDKKEQTESHSTKATGTKKLPASTSTVTPQVEGGVPAGVQPPAPLP